MILQIKNLSFEYPQGDNNLKILNNINLNIEEGKSIAIVGKSGSGKSTFLSLLSGIMKPTSGEISFLNKRIDLLSENERTKFLGKNLSIVFQSFHLMSTLTALENVMLPLEIHGALEAKNVAKKYLEEVGLSHRENHFPHELSGGEKQRVAIARALAINPKLILADEPSGNLDSETSPLVMDLLFKLVREHKGTLVLVTHDDDLSLKCDEIYKLENQNLVRIK